MVVEPNDQSALDGPDNIVVSPFGDLIIFEDGEGEQFLVGVTPNRELYDLAIRAGILRYARCGNREMKARVGAS